MLIIEDAIEKFHSELPPLVQSEFSSEEVMFVLHSLEEKYHQVLSPVVIRVAINEVRPEKIIDHLQSENEMSLDAATELSKELHSRIFDPIMERLYFLNKDVDKKITGNQEKNFAEKIFQTGLIKELNHDPVVIKAVNDRLFFLLSQDESYSDQLEKALYSNSETVGSKEILVNGIPSRPTIGNWLKDYIAQYGSQAFDSVSQTNFLLNSENGRKLSTEERELLAKIFKTYINIKFFPDSMPSDDGKGWEIIPGGEPEPMDKKKLPSSSSMSSPVVGQKSAQKIVSQPKQINVTIKPPVVEKKVTPSKPLIPVSPPKPMVKQNTQPTVPTPKVLPKAPIPVEHSDEVMNLKNMLLQYPADSLERKAIEEEIKKLS